MWQCLTVLCGDIYGVRSLVFPKSCHSWYFHNFSKWYKKSLANSAWRKSAYWAWKPLGSIKCSDERRNNFSAFSLLFIATSLPFFQISILNIQIFSSLCRCGRWWCVERRGPPHHLGTVRRRRFCPCSMGFGFFFGSVLIFSRPSVICCCFYGVLWWICLHGGSVSWVLFRQIWWSWVVSPSVSRWCCVIWDSLAAYKSV
jgi:hypothetical protein